MTTSGKFAVARGERGSALLVVLLFAAIVLIYLYKEMPVVTTEAQRSREEVLVYRGMQYQRAIQLYYRKLGRYPPSLEALESTNNIRFLRRRYKDPLTEEGEWRLLHMGPAGPIDSLVPPINNLNAQGQPFGQNAINQDGFGNSGQRSFGQSSFGQSSFGQSSLGQSGSGQNGFNSTPQPEASANPTNVQNGLPGDPSPYPNRRAAPVSAASDEATGGTLPAGQTDASGQPITGGERTGLVGQAAQPGQPGEPGGTGTAGQPGSVENQLLHTPSPSTNPQQQQQQAGGGSNPFGGGNLAGVASKGKGRSIKIINDQTDYSKWEFVYDFRKDTSRGVGFQSLNAGQGDNQKGSFTPGTSPAVGPAPATITSH